MATSPRSSPKVVPRPEPGLAVLYEPKDNEAEVDVIAVHGIGANADLTWESRGVNWLKHDDMLPSAAKTARIMRFSYNSQWLGPKNIVQHLSAIANDLLYSIRTMRKDFPERPIVFVCHCFGGIVVERAIITARLFREEWNVKTGSSDHHDGDLVDCISGIVFLGTPFRGSEAQKYADIIGNILSGVGLGNSKVYEMVSPHSQALKDQLNDFVRIINRQHIPSFCFFEKQKSDVGRIIKSPLVRLVVIVDEHSSTIDGISSLGLDADHFQIHRYSSPKDPNYKSVVFQLVDMINEAPHRTKARLYPRPMAICEEPVDSDSKKQSLRALSVSSPVDDKIHFQKQIGERYLAPEETYNWVQANAVYTRWLNRDDDPLLWIHGEEGQGKTPLMISLINGLTDKVERSSRQRALAYVFCLSPNGHQKDAAFIVRSILHQVLYQKKKNVNAFHHWSQAYQARGDALLNDVQSLWKIVQLTLTEAKLVVAYFVLYRPEECDPHIMAVFSSLLQADHTNCHIKWVVISSKHSGDYPKLKVSRRIDLATASTIEVPVIKPRRSSPISLSPMSLDTRETQSSRPTSWSSHEMKIPSPAEQDIKVRNLATVYCNRIEGHWICEIQTRRQDSGSLLIEATRLNHESNIIRHEILPEMALVPHTETSLSPERKLAISFLETQDLSLHDARKAWKFSGHLNYLFEDDSSFRWLQEAIYGGHLLSIQKTRHITSNRERESSKQDLRLWGSDDGQECIKLMFFPNSRTKYAKEYQVEPASLFKRIDPESIDPYTTDLRLEYQQNDVSETKESVSSKRIKFSFPSKKEEKLEYLIIQFLNSADRKDFLRHWPGSEVAKGKQPVTASDLLPYVARHQRSHE